MSAKRLHYTLISTICVLSISLVVATININKLFTTRANNLTQLKAKDAALEREKVTLKKTAKDTQTYTDLQKITQSVVPEDKSQAQAVREIVNIANQNGIVLSAITFPASTLGGTTSGAAATSQSSAKSSATNNKNTKLSQLVPVKNIPGVYQLPITVESDPEAPVRYDKFINFLGALERNRRTAQVSSITLSPSKENRNFLSFTLTLNNYIRP